MNKLREKPGRVLAIVAAAAVVLAGVAYGTGTWGSGDQVRVTAMFTDAAPMTPGNNVKASGVNVGTVESITVDDGRARMVLLVGKEVLPLHQDASANLITKDLLGERYVDLDRGSPSAPLLGDPSVIPADQTDRVVGVQEVLNTVDKPTGTALAGLVSTLGQGADGNGKEIAATIAALRPAMQQADKLAEILSQQNTLLTSLIDSAQPVARATATDRGRSLDRLVGSTTQTLSVTAENRKAVRDTLRRLPATLASARGRLSQIAGVADSTTRTLASLRPVTNDLTQLSGELERFAAASDPALASLPPVLTKADRMLDELGPLVRSLRPAGPDLQGVTKSYRRLADTALSLRLVDFMEFMKGWSLATSDYDAISHYFKAVTPYSPSAAAEFALGPVPGAPEDPLDETFEGVPGPGNLPIPGEPGDPEAPQATNATPSSDVSVGDSVTGLSKDQETNMVEQLLGGGL